jgi:putative nucleotidyltransferase with HDIG domain
MAAVRTLTALGTVLGERVGELARSAALSVSIPAHRGSQQAERALEVLLDRLCLSLILAKPVGVVSWAERETRRLGRASTVDLSQAATRAIVASAAAYDVDRPRLLAFLEVLSGEVERAALGLENDEPELSGSAESTTALLAMLAERDSGTCCHSKATAEWARRLATSMNSDGEATEFIALCALLHDVGKIATPEAILLKPGPLTDDEWTVMRQHSAAGARILNQIPSLARCAAIVRAHHERFDGSGYPDRLSGTAIPYEARVVAVADAFHAMISERPYREPISPRAALEILAEGRGTQWDPEIVDAMIAMVTRRSPAPPLAVPNRSA